MIWYLPTACSVPCGMSMNCRGGTSPNEGYELACGLLLCVADGDRRKEQHCCNKTPVNTRRKGNHIYCIEKMARATNGRGKRCYDGGAAPTPGAALLASPTQTARAHGTPGCKAALSWPHTCRRGMPIGTASSATRPGRQGRWGGGG